MTWDELRAMKQRNEVSYYERPPKADLGVLAEWDWRGRTTGDDYKMCDADKEGTASFYSYGPTSGETYISYSDKYGNNIRRLLENNDAWFKLKDNPAVFRPKAYPGGPASVCGFRLNYEVIAGTPDAPIPLGKMWFDTTRNALYLKTAN